MYAYVSVWANQSLLEEGGAKVFSRDSKVAPFGVGRQWIIRYTVLVEVFLQLGHQLLHVSQFGAQLHVSVREPVTLLTKLEKFFFSLLSATLGGFIIQVTASPKSFLFVKQNKEII